MSTLSLEKIRIERARQKMLEQEYEMRSGELLDAAEVDQFMFAQERRFREDWLAFAPELAAQLVAHFGGDAAKERELCKLLRETILEALDHIKPGEPIADQLGCRWSPDDVSGTKTIYPRTPGSCPKPKAVKGA